MTLKARTTRTPPALPKRASPAQVAGPLQRMADESTQVQRLNALTAKAEAVQRYPTINGTDRKDAVIYIIYDTNTKAILYVGQTTADREWDRWREHTTEDGWAPWYMDFNHYENARITWDHDYQVVEHLKNVTKFETTVAEQWWMEHYKTKSADLWNDSTPATATNFDKRSGNPSLYDPTNIGVDAGYKPSMKAK